MAGNSGLESFHVQRRSYRSRGSRYQSIIKCSIFCRHTKWSYGYGLSRGEDEKIFY